MYQRIVLALLAGLLSCLIFAQAATAQEARMDHTFFLVPRAGLSSYMGDQSAAFLSGAFGVDGKFPYAVGLDLGYQFGPRFALQGGYQLGNYPLINRGGRDADLLSDDPTTRHTVSLMGQYTLGSGRVAPYLAAGAHMTSGTTMPFGQNGEETRQAFGPSLGLGLDVALSPRTVLLFGLTSHLTMPDDAVDGRDGDRFGGFDMISSLGAGLKVNLRASAVAPDILEIDGPVALETNQSGTYTVRLQGTRATLPITYDWQWGDGARSQGPTATHSYTRPGTFTITVTASNRGGKDTFSKTVTVTNPAVPAAITAMRADPSNPDTATPVRLSASVRGDAPMTYLWDFGDGETSTEESPTHIFKQEGPHTVTLEVRNATGQDRRTLQVTVRPYLADICLEITEMNSAYFDRNSSALTATARKTLTDNLEILAECPNYTVRLEGWAAPGERNPLRLSQDRARAVEQFYVNGGILASRIDAVGRGAVTGTTSKKDGTGRFQRVDTILLPVPGFRSDR